MSRIKNLILRAFLVLCITSLSCGCSRANKARTAEQAQRDLDAGEYDKAKIDYLKLLRIDQENVVAMERLGSVWLDSGAPLRALPYLLRLRQLAPENLEGRTKLARAFQAIGGDSEARKEAAAILEQDAANLDAITILAETSRSKDEIAEAQEQLEHYPAKNTAAFHLAAASLAVRQENIGTASDEVQQAIAAEPKSARAHMIRAFIYLLRKDKARAEQELKTAAELAPPRSEERIKYAQFLAANGNPDAAQRVLKEITKAAPDYLPAWRDLAQIALTEKNYDEALSLLENIFSRDAENPEGRVLQANVWLGKGNSAKAIESLDKVSKIYPDNPLLKFYLGRAYLAGNKPAQAVSALEQAISLKPDYAEAALMLAELNMRLGKPEAVVSTMEDLVKKRPDLIQARLLLANAYRTLGRLDEAATLFRQHVNAMPGSSEAHLFLGMILRQQTKNDEARKEFEKAAELAPADDTRSIDQLVEMDLADGHYDVAMQRAQEQLQRNPNAAVGYFLKAKVDAAQHHWQEAEAALQKAIDIDAQFAPAYNFLVSVYVAQDKIPQAISRLEAEASKNPDNSRGLIMTGILYEQIKNYDKARDTYERVLTRMPNSILALNNLAVLYSERFNQRDRAYEPGPESTHPGAE